MLPGGMTTKTSRFEPTKNPKKFSLITSSSSSSSSSTSPPSSPSKTAIQEPQNRDIPLERRLATIIAKNENLLTGIFLKLPPKSLLRFQCVSKRWLSIISDPTFRRRHASSIRRRRRPTYDFLFFSSDSERNEIDLVSLAGDEVVSVGNVSSPLRFSLKGQISSLHCCNGLLCMQYKVNNLRRELTVYNPTTCKHKMIPWPNAENFPFVIRYANIAFDPLKSEHYKLVCVGMKNSYRFLVYSSESGVWKVNQDDIEISPDSLYHFADGVFWNGDLHYIGAHCRTLCFDVENERLRLTVALIPTNLQVMGRSVVTYFGETGGNLCVIVLNEPKTLVYDVFALKRNYSRWVVKYRVDFAPLITYYPEMKDRGFHTPCILMDDEGRKARIVISLEDKFVCYDINGMFVKELVGVKPVYAEVAGWGDSTRYKWYEAYNYVDTLASV